VDIHRGDIMAYIYKITNKVNGKVYIGKTSLLDPFERWVQHRADYKRKRFEKRIIYQAMNKYGIDNFIFEVIEETDNDIEREKFYINLYTSYVGFIDSNGYNATLGGDGKSYIDESEVVEYYLENIENTIAKTAEALDISREWASHILRKNKIIIRQPNDYSSATPKKPVYKIDNKTKEIIKEYPSISHAAEEFGGRLFRAHIAKVCHGRRKTAYGFIWRFKEL
jgi:group I intron endonuclease